MKFIKYDADNPVNFKNPLILIYPVNPSILKILIQTMLFIFFSVNTLHALTPVIIDENTESVSLGKYMEILEDPSGKLTIDDVTKPEMQGRWFQSKWDEPNFGKTMSAFWVRFEVKDSSKKIEHLLESDWPLYDKINLFYLKNDILLSDKCFGNIYRFALREKFDNKFVFNLPADLNEYKIFIRIQTETSVQLPFKIITQNYYEKESKYNLLLKSIFFGILSVMFFYNLLLFLALKDLSFLYYIIYLFSQIYLHLTYFNFGYQFLWSNYPWFNMHSLPVSIGLAGITSLLFAKQFLGIDKNYRKLNTYYRIFIMLFLVFMIWSLYTIYLPLKLINILGFVWTPSLLISSIYVYKQNYRAARFFLISWFVILVCTLILMMKNLGILPISFFTTNSTIIGISLEVVLLSFALADRINIMKKEKEMARDESLRIQKDATETLELKVTERTAELAEANDKLRELDKAKTDFFANVSHELRTPLTLILASVEEALSGRDLNRNTLEMIRRNALDLLSLINGLLEMSRITAGKHKLNIAETDLSETVKQFCGGMESAAKLKGIGLACSAEKPVTIYADHDRLSNIISNFFSNSFKFTEPGGKIEVTVRSDKTSAILEFKDTGCGIPSDKLDTIFDRFTQADTGSTRKYEGTGIGLSIVKELVELHGGEVSVESRCAEDDTENHGTLFTVKLPFGKEHFENRDDVEFVDRGKNTPVIISHVRGIEASGTAERRIETLSETAPAVLVVEDNSDLRSLLVNMLSERYIVHEASNGFEAVKILESTDEIDLVLSDIMMPNMDGHELLQWIRGNEKLEGLPVLLLTARADHFMRIEGLDLGATDYVTKPFNSDELLLRIKNQMELKILRNKTERNYRKLLEKLEGVKTRFPSKESTAKIEAVCQFIKENYTCELTREDLATASGMNPDTFSRLFNQYTAKTLNDYICDLRIEEAKRRLAETGETVTRIAIDTGFDNIRTFNRVFKRLAGVAPLVFREGLRN